MMSRANFGAEEDPFSTLRELSMKEDLMGRGAFGKCPVRFISTQRSDSHEQLCERLAITHAMSRRRGSAQRQADAARCDRRAWSARSHSEHARPRACRPP